MSKVAVVTDSTADIPAEVAAAQGVRVVPCHLLFGDQVFHDGVDIRPAEFYRRLRQSEVLPTTSQPSSGEFISVYRELSEWADSIVSIHVSSALSGTLESAHTAVAQMGLHVPIYVVDSRVVSMALGLVVLAAAEMAATGQDALEIVERTRDLIPKVNVLFMVDTLQYLHRGGRIGGAERLAGSLLSIKPLLHIVDGRIEVLEKTRTRQRAVARLLDVIGERVGSARAVRFAVAHADAENEALRLKAEIERRFQHRVSYLCELSSAVGTHGGPGVVGAAFYIEE